MMIC